MSLQPVYKVLKDDEPIELQQIEIAESHPGLENSSSESGSLKSAASDSNNACKSWCRKACSSKDTKSDNDCCKNKRRSFGRRLCGCICGFLLFGTLIWLIGGVAVLSYIGVRTYRCLNPKFSDTVQYTFTDAEVKAFDIGIVSGTINVHTCPVADKITLRVTNKAASHDLLETMPMSKKLVDGLLTLNVLAPSFDFHRCQHTEVMLVIPERMAKTKQLSLKAQTILGKIVVDAPKHTFAKLSVFANVGIVHAHDVTVQEEAEIETKIGRVVAAHVNAKAVLLKSTFGYVSAEHVKSADTVVSVETGKAKLASLEGASVKVSSDFGYICGWNFNTPYLDARVEYGLLNYWSKSSWEGEFTVASPYGFIDVKHDNHVNSPRLLQNTPAIIQGSFGKENTLPATSGVIAKPNHISLQAQFANVNFFVQK